MGTVGLKKGPTGSRSRRTCTQEEDLVASIGRRDLVNSDGGELVVHVGPDHQRALVDGVHRVVHGGVVTHKVDDLVGVILGGLHVGGEGSSGTLRKDGGIHRHRFSRNSTHNRKHRKNGSLFACERIRQKYSHKHTNIQHTIMGSTRKEPSTNT